MFVTFYTWNKYDLIKSVWSNIISIMLSKIVTGVTEKALKQLTSTVIETKLHMDLI